jgi:hypothetical protein
MCLPLMISRTDNRYVNSSYREDVSPHKLGGNLLFLAMDGQKRILDLDDYDVRLGQNYV